MNSLDTLENETNIRMIALYDNEEVSTVLCVPQSTIFSFLIADL